MQKDVLFSRAHCSFIPWMVSFALTLSALQTWFSGTCSFLFIVSKYSHPVFCSKIRYLDLLFPDEHLYTSLATSGCLGRLSPHVTCGPVWALWQGHRIKQYCPHHTPSVGISVQRLSPRPRCLKLTWPPPAEGSSSCWVCDASWKHGHVRLRSSSFWHPGLCGPSFISFLTVPALVASHQCFWTVQSKLLPSPLSSYFLTIFIFMKCCFHPHVYTWRLLCFFFVVVYWR